jgi:hypothetical protein
LFVGAASEADVIQCRVVVVSDPAVVRLDAGLQSANSAFTSLAVLAPDAVGVPDPIDFAIVVAHEPNIVGRRLVALFRLVERQLDSQRETCHVRDGKGRSANLNSLIISSAK